MLSQRWPTQEFGITHILNFPWTHPQSPITKLIHESKASFFETDSQRMKWFNRIPVSLYRQHTQCFSLQIRQYLWEILGSEPYLSQLTETHMMEIKKALTFAMKETKKLTLTQIQVLIDGLLQK